MTHRNAKSEREGILPSWVLFGLPLRHLPVEVKFSSEECKDKHLCLLKYVNTFQVLLFWKSTACKHIDHSCDSYRATLVEGRGFKSMESPSFPLHHTQVSITFLFQWVKMPQCHSDSGHTHQRESPSIGVKRLAWISLCAAKIQCSKSSLAHSYHNVKEILKVDFSDIGFSP